MGSLMHATIACMKQLEYAQKTWEKNVKIQKVWVSESYLSVFSIL